jgi:hypothetical protein
MFRSPGHRDHGIHRTDRLVERSDRVGIGKIDWKVSALVPRTANARRTTRPIVRLAPITAIRIAPLLYVIQAFRFAVRGRDVRTKQSSK